MLVILTQTSPGQRDKLWLEIAKGLIQLVVVVALGTALKLLADSYQAKEAERRLEAAQLRSRADDEAQVRREFWVAARQRLVGVANHVRRASTLTAANRSVKTWSDEMVALIGARGELSTIYHEVGAALPIDAPQHKHGAIYTELDRMGEYIGWLEDDFRNKKKALGEKQRKAEDEKLPEAERKQQQDALWDELVSLDSVADLVELGRHKIRRPERHSTLHTHARWSSPLRSSSGIVDWKPEPRTA